MTVGNESGGEAIFCQLRPYGIGMARKNRCNPVAQMRAEGCACRRCCVNPLRRGVRMPEGYMNTLRCECVDEGKRILPVGRERDHAHKTAACGLPAFEFGDARGADIVATMRSAGAILWRDKWAFDMDEWNGMSSQRAGVARLSDDPQSSHDFLFGSSDNGGCKGGDTCGGPPLPLRKDHICVG